MNIFYNDKWIIFKMSTEYKYSVFTLLFPWFYSSCKYQEIAQFFTSLKLKSIRKRCRKRKDGNEFSIFSLFRYPIDIKQQTSTPWCYFLNSSHLFSFNYPSKSIFAHLDFIQRPLPNSCDVTLRVENWEMRYLDKINRCIDAFVVE